MLVDPIWDTLRDNNCFNLIVRQSFTEVEHKGVRAGYCHMPFHITQKLGMCRWKQVFASLARLPGGVVCDSRLFSCRTQYSLPTKWGLSEKLCTPDRLGPWVQAVRDQGF